jgi:uncharacterized protein GlcG (DUF336 family)
MSELTIERRSVSAEAAQALVAAAVDHTRKSGGAVAIVVCDMDGATKASLRMDGASHFSIALAEDKAYTAATFGVATDQWFDLIKDDGPLLHGVPTTPRFSVIGGGYPLKLDGQVVGGIAVSGGAPPDDVECARSAAAAAGFEV